MLESFAPQHPSSWTAQDLVEAGNTNTLDYTIDNTNIPTAATKLSQQYNSLDRQEIEREGATEDLSISLDFLQGEEEEEEELQRGRLRPKQIRPFPNLNHLSAKPPNGSSFSSDSPETESPPGSEQEWRRSLAVQGDPIHKTGHRSNSRDPPTFIQRNKSQYLFGVSPPFESSSPSSLSSFGGRVDPDTSNQNRSTSQQGSSNNKWSSSYRPTQDHLQSQQPSSDGHDATLNAGSNRSFSNDQSQRYPTTYRSTYSTNNVMSSSSPDRVNRPAIQSSMSGLPTMHEEAASGDHLSSLNQRGNSDLNRIPRHRSTSSAAALQHDDRSSLFNRDNGNGNETFQRSVSLWRGELGGMSPDTYARAAATNQQQGSVGSDQYQFQSMSPPTSFPSPPSGSTRWTDRGRRNEYANVHSSFDAFPEEVSQGHTKAATGVEMDSSNLSAQRRAIGFEVGRPIGSTSRTSSVGRQASTPRAADTLSNRLFSNGSGLAITDDDLGTDFQNLRLNLDDVQPRPNQRQYSQEEEERRRMNMRIPSSNAAMSGVHAASVPSGFGSGGNHTFAQFGQSPPIGSNISRFGGTGSQWPVSARLRSDEDNASSNWNDLIPSPSNRSSNFTESSQGYQQPPSQQSHSTSIRSEIQSDEQQRKYGLSASAKVFQGGSTFAETAPSPSTFTSQHQTFVPAQRFTRDTSAGYGTAHQGMPFAGQAAAAKSSTSPHRSTSSDPLSEVAIASLVTLGPLAPASGGGPGDGPSGAGAGGGSLQELGKGVPLQMLPRSTTLFIVEFKEGRTDIYFRQLQSGSSITDEIQKGDLVIVEADRGKDLGTVVNDCITVHQVQTFLAQQSELLAQQASITSSPGGATSTPGGDTPHPAAISLSRLSRSMNPKRLFAKAGPADTSLLHSKAQDEERALTLCTTKVNQRGLPMIVVAAELQWDRRKLTFYYTATQRVDFRDLVKELFRLYKTRIWMCHLSHPSGTGLP